MADYYVSVTGSDVTAGGSAAAPWRTIKYASTRISAGNHRILVGEGTFLESQSIQLALGVSIIGSGVGTTIIQSTFSTGWLFSCESSPVTASSFVFRDFTLDGMNKALKAGFLIRGRGGVAFTNLLFQDIDENAITIIAEWGPTKTVPPTAYLDGFTISNSTFVNCAKDASTFSFGAIQIGGVQNGSISNITIQESRGYGIKKFNNGWIRNLLIENCSITVPDDDVLWGADAAIELWNVFDNCCIRNVISNQWFSIVLGNKGSGQYSILIENCIINTTKNTGDNATIEMIASDAIIQNNYLVNPSRYGIALWSGGDNPSVANVKIFRNIVEGGAHPNSRFVHLGPDVNKTLTNVDVSNNTVVNIENVVVCSIGFTNAGVTSNVNFRNNIFTGANTIFNLNHSFCSNFQASNNIFHAYGVLQTSGGSLILSGNLTTSPQLNLTGNKPLEYFGLTISSPAIDAGVQTEATPIFYGIAPDIGAIEYIPPTNSQRSLILGSSKKTKSLL